VSGLEEEFKDRVVAQNVDATTEKSRAEVAKLEFHNHGLVIRDSAGEVLFKQPDHEVKMDDVRDELKKRLVTPTEE